MDHVLILETSFIVDLEREARRGVPGPAHAFLEAHPDDTFAIALHTAGELASGVVGSEKEGWERLVRRFRALVPDHEVAWRYGQLYAFLKRNGLAIGANDLWIAATALALGAPVVTRDTGHFQRVPELEVMGY